MLVLAGGCARELPTYYGRHQLPLQPASVNGTDVLAEMFREAGHDVYFRGTLVTGQLSAANTIVWTPDDFAAPNEEVCDWFDNWLFEEPGRTLVYVGRDFNAAPLYWEKLTPEVGEDLKKAYELRRLDARVDNLPEDTDAEELECEWFRFEPGKQRQVKELSGPWSAGIDPGKTDLQVRTRLIPNGASRRLLADEQDPLVASFARRYWVGGRILLVTNGSFLLNLPLVNHENRRLAARLIDAVGEPGNVVFLESFPGGPPVDPPYVSQSLWQLLGAWPLNVILLQLALAGVIFCFARWPIFGRPRQPATEPTSDFGKHVTAVGQLLARTKDRAFALARVAPHEAPQHAATSTAAGTSFPPTKSPDS